MGSFFDNPYQSEIKIKTISAFYTRYSNIPPFHYSMKSLKLSLTPVRQNQSMDLWDVFFTDKLHDCLCKAGVQNISLDDLPEYFYANTET